MTANQPPWPREWLMTDERIGDRLWKAVDALPDGRAGIVLRHYSLSPGERSRLARQVSEICRQRHLVLAVARDGELAAQVGAQLVHNPLANPTGLPFSRSAHSAEEAAAANLAGASLIFLSPIFETRSHPGRKAMASEVTRQIVAACSVPVIALGGMNRALLSEHQNIGFYGWAGIDAWIKT
jgi:thiamine-phosphate pyrophosphorylase